MTSRYKRIYTQVWGDAKFVALSKPGPCAQHLWFFLMTGPHCGTLPGIFRATVEGVAAELGWPVSDTEAAFGELEAAGMAEIDRASRVVSIPKAPWYDPPNSLNVLVAWRRELDALPECDTVDRHARRIIDAVSELVPGFADKASEMLSPKASRKASPKPKQMAKGMPKAKASGKASPTPIPIPEPLPKKEEGRGGEGERSLKLGSPQPLPLLDPTEGMSPRQIEAFKALEEFPFLVAGEGHVFGSDIAPDPRRLALDLGGDAFPNVSPRRTLAAVVAYLNANPAKAKTRRGFERFLVSWFEREQNSGWKGSREAPAPQAQQGPMQRPRDLVALVNRTTGKLGGEGPK